MLNALVVLYFIDQLRLLTALLPLVGRLVFSAEMLGGTLFLIWLILDQAFTGRWREYNEAFLRERFDLLYKSA
jgi:hypothetical protein